MTALRAFALALALFMLLPRAVAASPSARLVYGRTDAEQCPDEEALRKAVAARVGYDPFFPIAPRTVIVTIAARGGQFVARIELVDDQAHAQRARELVSKGADCGDLFDTVALAISIAIDPKSLARPASPVSAPSPTPAPEPDAPASIETPVAPPAPVAEAEGASPPVSDLRGRIGAGLRTSLGLSPGPALGFVLGGSLDWRRLSLGAELSIDLPSGADESGGVTVRSWLAAATLAPCVRFAPLHLCALAMAGRLEGSASGVTGPRTKSALLLAFGGRVGVELPLTGRLSAVAQADLLAEAAPAALDVGSTPEWTTPTVAGVASLLAVVSF